MNCASFIAADVPSFLPMLGAGGSLWVLLAVIIGSAIADWLKKRAAKTGAEGLPGEEPPRRTAATSQPGSASAPAPQTNTWEEELRRLLGVEPPPAKPRAATPPPVPEVRVPQPKQPSPRKTVTVAPAGGLARLARIEPEFTEAQRVPAFHLRELRESSAAYQHASRLQERVAAQLKHVDEQTERHLAKLPPARPDSFSLEATRVVSLLHDPRTARQVVIASVILALPKGLASE